MFSAKLSGTTMERTAKNPDSSAGFAPVDVFFDIKEPTTTVPAPATVSLSSPRAKTPA